MENAARDGFSLDQGMTVMPIKCTGLIKVSYLLKLFANGIEGVLILGCREGDCHYYNGSERCGKIVDETREILSLAGIPAKRLGFDLIADSQGKEFKRVVLAFGKQFAGKPSRRTLRGKTTPKKTVKRKVARKKAAAKSTVRSRRGV
jgi:coenzyme F420-reducing hydrogenase delta subunit